MALKWTDEAHFMLHEAVNTHNCRIWTKENSHAYTEELLHLPVVNDKCGFIASANVGSFYFF